MLKIGLNLSERPLRLFSRRLPIFFQDDLMIEWNVGEAIESVGKGWGEEQHRDNYENRTRHYHLTLKLSHRSRWRG